MRISVAIVLITMGAIVVATAMYLYAEVSRGPDCPAKTGGHADTCAHGDTRTCSDTHRRGCNRRSRPDANRSFGRPRAAADTFPESRRSENSATG